VSAYTDEYLAVIRADRAKAYAAGEAFVSHIEYEPRWHGWARTETRHNEPTHNQSLWMCRTLARGWKRRPKGSPYQERNVPAWTEEAEPTWQ
jgi:hypothetical protein